MYNIIVCSKFHFKNPILFEYFRKKTAKYYTPNSLLPPQPDCEKPPHVYPDHCTNFRHNLRPSHRVMREASRVFGTTLAIISLLRICVALYHRWLPEKQPTAISLEKCLRCYSTTCLYSYCDCCKKIFTCLAFLE